MTGVSNLGEVDVSELLVTHEVLDTPTHGGEFVIQIRVLVAKWHTAVLILECAVSTWQGLLNRDGSAQGRPASL